ncbi:MAG TPA: AAA family ATPase [Gemmata sp.]
MSSTHSNPAAGALRALRTGPGGGALVVCGEPGTGALFPAGAARPPVPTLFESVLAHVADPGGYANIWVLSAGGEHMPTGVLVGSARLHADRTSCAWAYRGAPAPPAAPPPPPAGPQPLDDDDAILIRLGSGAGTGDPPAAPLADGPGGFQLLEGGLIETLTRLLVWVETAAGKMIQENGEYRPALGAPAGRTLVILDAHLLVPNSAQDANTAAEMPAQLRRRIVDRLNALPGRVLAGTGTDLVLLAPSHATVSRLRDGRLIHDEIIQLLPNRRRNQDDTALDASLPRMHWPHAPAVEMPRLDRAHPLEASFALAPADRKRSVYDLLRTVPPRVVPDPLAELNAMTGLGGVKTKLREVFDLVELARRRRALGAAGGDAPMLHLVFAGNPGTGKTTVARIVARVYARSGLLTGNKFTEITAGDLVAGFVGQTRGKAQETLDRAAGGVLFIDEAYDLTPKGDNDFTAEVVALLLRWMTERRSDLAIIMAGYANEMRELLNSNPGFDRRIEWVPFDDYSDDELLTIARAKVRAAGEQLAPGADRVLGEKLAEHRAACARAGRPFGNAGEVERLLQKVRAAVGARTRTSGDVMTILPEDVSAARIPLPEARRPRP